MVIDMFLSFLKTSSLGITLPSASCSKDNLDRAFGNLSSAIVFAQICRPGSRSILSIAVPKLWLRDITEFHSGSNIAVLSKELLLVPPMRLYHEISERHVQFHAEWSC